MLRMGAAAATAAMTILLAVSPARANGPVSVGETFPSFTAKDMRTSKDVSIAAMKGKVVLIDFWATWCGPCKGEIPHIKELYDKHAKEGLEVVSVSLDKKEKTARDYADKNGMSWHQVFDEGGKIAGQYGVRGIPQVYVVGRDGKVVLAQTGTNTGSRAALDEAIRKALAAKP